ncbi:MAG: ABC transporter ATP-binding protein [Myxococcales bacterium]|nr:ABC transporter ATP-binding protein [Myxococcales bacterium]
MNTNPLAIEIKGLSKQFKDMKAVDDISFSVHAGEIFGFMGHNGAGKTTTIRMLLGLTKPTAGTASILGHDIQTASLEIRRLCGFLPASFSLPADMTPTSFLHYIAAMFGMTGKGVSGKIDELLTQFDLTKVAKKKLGGFSTGMMQKVGLAQALINQPRIIFLDEPTAGLDPIGRHDFLQYIQRLSKEQGVTIMFSTHILSDIESICERVGIIHQGKKLTEGELASLKQQYDEKNMDDLYLKLVQGASL